MMFAFRKAKVINRDQAKLSAMVDLEKHISPESSIAGSRARAFPFCIIEAKRVSRTSVNTVLH